MYFWSWFVLTLFLSVIALGLHLSWVALDKISPQQNSCPPLGPH